MKCARRRKLASLGEICPSRPKRPPPPAPYLPDHFEEQAGDESAGHHASENDDDFQRGQVRHDGRRWRTDGRVGAVVVAAVIVWKADGSRGRRRHVRRPDGRKRKASGLAARPPKRRHD